jgi:hypothetical protein
LSTNHDDLREKARRLRSAIPERRTATPPPENGRRLATCQRGPDEELRVNWADYEGRPYLSLRLWTRDDHGQWWPDGKRGMAVRIRELPDVATAIAEALDLAEAHQRQRPHGQHQPARGGGARRDWRPPPDVQPDGGEFSEFEGNER